MDTAEYWIKRGFDKEQANELMLAHKFGQLQSTECEKHMEWPAMLMNACWNAEKEGQSLEPIYTVASFLQENFPKKDGKLYGDLEVLMEMINAAKEKGILPEPEFALGSEIDKPDYMFKLTREAMLRHGSKRLDSGRVSYTEVKTFEPLEKLMAEGDQEVFDAIRKLQQFAASNAENSSDPLVSMQQRQWGMQNILLGLDDMNIRGYQIKYALEYTDGSIHKLFQILRQSPRSQTLCDYINKKSAEDFLSGIESHNQVAVTGGASFRHGDNILNAYMGEDQIPLNLTQATAKRYMTYSTESLKVDYSTRDIFREVSMDEGCKIIESRGFELIRKIPKERTAWENEEAYYMLFLNRKTGDYIEAGRVTKSDMCYGGMELKMIRTFPDDFSLHQLVGFKGSTSPLEGQAGVMLTLSRDGGLFKGYETLASYATPDAFDWSKIGFSLSGLYIPEYVDVMNMLSRSWDEELPASAQIILRGNGVQYRIEWLANALIALSDTELVSQDSHYSTFEKWLIDEGGWTTYIGWFCGCDNTAAQLSSIVAHYIGLSDAMKDRMIEGGVRHFAERDARCAESGIPSDEADDFRESAQLFKEDYQYADKVIEVIQLSPLSHLPFQLKKL